jgi:RNA polymerase sigma-70 factor (ECF subfamily)
MANQPHIRLVTDPASATERPASAVAWRAFYAANWQWIYGVMRRMTGPGIDVEDAVQDVFVAISQKLSTFEGRSRLGTWIYRICLNVASEHRRRKRRRERIAQMTQWLLPWLRRPTVHDEVTARDELRQVRAALALMSRDKREVFVLREIEQLSGDEVAAVLGIPHATVRTRLLHARREFARLLAAAEGEA